jgi:hypothetical protein
MDELAIKITDYCMHHVNTVCIRKHAGYRHGATFCKKKCSLCLSRPAKVQRVQWSPESSHESNDKPKKWYLRHQEKMSRNILTYCRNIFQGRAIEACLVRFLV